MKYLLVFMSLCILQSCSQKSADQLFKPLPDVTKDMLLKQSYVRQWGVDVAVYRKQVDGILFKYQFYDIEGQNLGYQTWVFEELFLSSEKEYEEKLKELDFYPETKVALNQRVAISHNITHVIYLSYLNSEGILSISYQHPSRLK